MLKNKKLLFGVIIVVAAIAFLGIRAFAGTATYYYEIQELVLKGESAYNTGVKVRGLVDDESVVRKAENATLEFRLVDENRTVSLNVRYQGAVPDTFAEGAEVVCEGKLTQDGVFTAVTLLPKCPSKYSVAPGQPG